jgi:hypothetical protein
MKTNYNVPAVYEWINGKWCFNGKPCHVVGGIANIWVAFCSDAGQDDIKIVVCPNGCGIQKKMTLF